MVNNFFLHLGYSNEAKATMLETALFYKDRPTLATEVSIPKPETKDGNGKITRVGPTQLQMFHGYNLRKQHVQLSQEVPFCTNLHIDFLQTAK